MGDPRHTEIEKNTVEESLLQSMEEGPQVQEEEEIPIECQFFSSDNDVDNDDFHYEKNASNHIEIGLHADPASEIEVGGEEEKSSDELDCPSEEELHTDYSSSEENICHFPVYDPEKEKLNPQLEVGKEFKNIEEFRQAVRNHGIATRCNLRFRPNDEFRAQAICKLGCKWKIWASWNKKKGCVQIKSANLEHTCVRDRTNRHCTARYIADRYLDTFKIDPDWKSKLIMKAVKDDLKLTINKVTAWRARRYARLLIHGSDEHQFGMLRSFAAEILRSNPGSTCIVAIHELKFQGVYLCLEACKRGFLSGCRQLLGLDGCFLKGTFGGQMLVAVALDANDCIYPVAYAIVQGENATTWRWFLQHLGEDLKILNSKDWTFMTDRQKGLQNVIDDLYPEAEHRFCVRHMYSNFFRAEFKSLTLKDYLWRAARSTTVADWNFWMGEIEKESKAAHSWLKKRHPSEWSKAYFMTKVKSDILLNNLCEVFNNVVLEEREKSILTMLIDLHLSFMKRIQARRDKMRKVNGPLCPKVQQKLLKSYELANGCEVDWSGGAQSYVKCPSGEFVVDLHSKMCACRRWDLSGIPCAHAIAAILDRREEPWRYVHECYKVSTYLSCYENIINPINGMKLWPSVDALPVKPPNWVVSKRGRKQKKRRRQAEEDVITYVGSKGKLKKKGLTEITCSVCGGSGHNMRSHQKVGSANEACYENVTSFANEDMSNHVVSDNSRVKLVPRRLLSNTTSEVQPSTPNSNFQFMPTPGIGVTSASQLKNYGPPPDQPGSLTMEKAPPQMQTTCIPLESMVKDFQNIENQETERKRAAMIKNKKVVRGSVTFVPPRLNKNSATQ